MQLKLCTPAHMRVFMHTCVQERERCVNMLIQAQIRPTDNFSCVPVLVCPAVCGQ